MNLEIDRSGQLSYFLRDPLFDLRDLCVNLGHASIQAVAVTRDGRLVVSCSRLCLLS